MVENEKGEDFGDCEVLNMGSGGQELLLQVMRGIAKPHTLKIRGSIAGLLVVALIDSGASHNLLSEEAAFKLGFKRDKEEKFWVCLGDGRKKKKN